METNQTTLIIGGTGKTGRRIAQRLTAAGVRVRIASRTAAPPFEWTDRTTWPAIVQGASAMYLAYHPDLAMPGAADDIGALTKLAVACGVRRIVLLSGRGEDQVLPSERAVRESGAEYTILRAAWFAQNFSEGALREPVLAGEVAFPAGNVAEPFVDADDIADVAVAALTDPRHAGTTYELTGPRLVTFAEAVAEISRATERDVRYVPVSPAAYAKVLADFMPAEQAGFITELFAGLLDGHNAHLTDGVQRALGRPPRDFRELVRAAARAGAWQR